MVIPLLVKVFPSTKYVIQKSFVTFCTKKCFKKTHAGVPPIMSWFMMQYLLGILGPQIEHDVTQNYFPMRVTRENNNNHNS